MNLGSLSFDERMNSKGLRTNLKGKHLELAKRAAGEGLVEYMRVSWLSAEDLAPRVLVVVDEGIRAEYSYSLLLGLGQSEVTRDYHVAAHTAVEAEEGVG